MGGNEQTKGSDEQDRLPGDEGTPVEDPIRIQFTNPDLLLAFITDPNRPGGKVTYAERKAGVREVSLGEYQLDRELFQSVTFSLVIEAGAGEEKAPTVIVRADVALGDAPSALKLFQQNKAGYIQPPPKESLDYMGEVSRVLEMSEVSRALTNSEFPLGGWSNNTGRMYTRQSEKDTMSPLTLLQLWEKDAGINTVSISLMNYHVYDTTLEQKYTNADRASVIRQLEERKKVHRQGDPWPTITALSEDVKDVDAIWDFSTPVGIQTNDPEQFQKAVHFYETAFSEILTALYKTEGKPVPAVNFEIEPPALLREDEQLTMFSDVIGQDKAVESLQAIVEAEKNGEKTSPKPVFLLEGPPGNGKTTLLHATANELGAPLIIVTPRSLSSGASGVEFINLLESAYFQAKSEARKAGNRKAVFGIEDPEAMLGQDGQIHQMFTHLMDEWSTDKDADVLVIATTNFPRILLPAILDRFTILDVFAPQNTKNVEAIMTRLLAKLARQVGRSDLLSEDVDLESVADKLKTKPDFSGRDILNFLINVYRIRRSESQRVGHWLPMDTEFLLEKIPTVRTFGFNLTPKQ